MTPLHRAILLICVFACPGVLSASAQTTAAPATAPSAPAPATPAATPLPPIVPLASFTPPAGATSSVPGENTIRGLQSRVLDFAQLGRYRDDNATLGSPAPGEKRVVFLGDSLTDNWGRRYGKFFPGKPWINRGISGQTTSQMLLRFQQDVVALHPAAVVILAGTNDIAGNTGPENLDMIEDNLRSMVAIAGANHIRVVLSSALPSSHFNWAPTVQPAEPIRQLNTWIARFCAQEKLTYLDYYTALVDTDGGIRPNLAQDRTVHPNDAGYAIMEPLAEKAVTEALKQQP